MKRIFAFLLTLVMLVGMLPAVALPASAAESTNSGVCGDNLTWSYNSGTLTISGTGPMYDYSEENPAPWHNLQLVYSFSISQGVTSIGAYAFYKQSTYSNITISIPKSITVIGSKAFAQLSRSILLAFYCKAPSIAEDAFEGSSLSCYYMYGWDAVSRQKYGGKSVSWSAGKVNTSNNSKLAYQLNEPITNEDFLLAYQKDPYVASYQYYSPSDLLVGDYDNSTPGEKTVEVTADGITFTHKYVVIEGDLADNIAINYSKIAYYSGKAIEPKPTITVGSVQLVQGVHYSLTWSNNIAVGNDARILVTGLNELEDFSKELPFSILRKDLSDGSISVSSQYFTGEPLTPEAKIYINGGYLTQGEDYILYYENNTNIGTATCYAIGIGNYCGMISTQFAIQYYSDTIILAGILNGELDKPLEDEGYYYEEIVIAPGKATFRPNAKINGDRWVEHIALYQLSRIINGQNILVATKETEFGYPKVTDFVYDFSDVYLEDMESGGAEYVLSYTWVDSFYEVRSGMLKLIIPAKVPDAAAIAIGAVDNISNYRYAYMGVHGLYGNVGNVTWSSSDPSVASVKNGVLTMHKLGPVTITAQYGDLTASTDIQIMAEDFSQARIVSYDAATGEAIVVYDGFRLEEGVDYTISVSDEDGLPMVIATGMGVFEGQTSQSFDKHGIPAPLPPVSTLEESVTPPQLPYVPSGMFFRDEVIIYSPAYNVVLSAQHATFSNYRSIGIPFNLVTYGDVWDVVSHHISESGSPVLYGYIFKGVNSKELSVNPNISALSQGEETYEWLVCEVGNGTYALQNHATKNYLYWSEELGAFTLGTGDPREDDRYQLQFKIISSKPKFTEQIDTPQVTVEGNILYWDPIEHADAYDVFRSTSKNGKYSRIGTVFALGCYDSSATIGKTYYYKVKAVYGSHEASSSELSEPVAITHTCEAPYVSVENNSSGKPYLSWYTVSGAKKYTVYRATSENGKYSKLGTTTKAYYTDSNAKAGTTYYYKVIANASSSKYDSGYSNIVSCPVICGTPSVTVKIDAATGKPTLSWKKVDAATGYVIYRDGEVLTTVTAVTYTDSTAAIDTQYSYAVQALGKTEDLNGVASKEVAATSGIARPAPKGSIDAVTGKPVITWDAIEGAVSYNIYRSTSSSKSYKLVATVQELTYTDESVSAGKTYYYKVEAVGEVSKSAQSSYVKMTGKCATPEISVENNTSGKPYLSWEKVSGAKKYTVYRATSETGKYSKLGTTTKAYYTDSKATAGKTYFYKIIANASSSKNNSGYSNIVSCPVICGTPSVTVKVDAATGKPSLSWKKITGAVSYRILRQLPGESDFTVIAEQTGVTFLDTTAPIDTKCAYMVQTLGTDETLHGQLSKVLEVTSSIAKPAAKGSIDAVSGKPVITWDAIEGAVSYNIYRSTSSSKNYKLLTTVETLTYTDESVSAGKTYYYKVEAVGEVSKSAQSSYVKMTGKCATPIISVENNASGKPYLSWEKVSGAKKYTVYRATSETGKYTKLGTTTKAYYTDSKATAGKTYFYKIIANASSSKNNSGYSNIVSCPVICATPALKVTNNALGQPVISWSKVSGATQYKVTYQVGHLGGGQPAVHEEYITGTSFTIESASADTFGWVEVIAIAENELLNSMPAQAEVEGRPATPKLTGKVGGNNKPVISWEYKGDAIVYEVYRSTKSGSGYKLIGEVDLMSDEEASQIQTYEDLTAAKGKTYYYKVVAVSWNSESPMSSYVKVKSK